MLISSKTILKQTVKMDKDLKTALRLAEHVGMPYVMDRPSPYQWDGEMAYFGGITANNVIHEIAHFIVAGPRKRKKKEFGIGVAPDALVGDLGYDAYKRSLGTVSMKAARAEEERASVLGIRILEELEMDMLAKDDMSEHGWTNNMANKTKFAKLAKSKKYYENGVPKCLQGFK